MWTQEVESRPCSPLGAPLFPTALWIALLSASIATRTSQARVDGRRPGDPLLSPSKPKPLVLKEMGCQVRRFLRDLHAWTWRGDWRTRMRLRVLRCTVPKIFLSACQTPTTAFSSVARFLVTTDVEVDAAWTRIVGSTFTVRGALCGGWRRCLRPSCGPSARPERNNRSDLPHKCRSSNCRRSQGKVQARRSMCSAAAAITVHAEPGKARQPKALPPQQCRHVAIVLTVRSPENWEETSTTPSSTMRSPAQEWALV